MTLPISWYTNIRIFYHRFGPKAFEGRHIRIRNTKCNQHVYIREFNVIVVKKKLNGSDNTVVSNHFHYNLKEYNVQFCSVLLFILGCLISNIINHSQYLLRENRFSRSNEQIYAKLWKLCERAFKYFKYFFQFIEFQCFTLPLRKYFVMPIASFSKFRLPIQIYLNKTDISAVTSFVIQNSGCWNY